MISLKNFETTVFVNGPNVKLLSLFNYFFHCVFLLHLLSFRSSQLFLKRVNKLKQIFKNKINKINKQRTVNYCVCFREKYTDYLFTKLSCLLHLSNSELVLLSFLLLLQDLLIFVCETSF